MATARHKWSPRDPRNKPAKDKEPVDGDQLVGIVEQLVIRPGRTQSGRVCQHERAIVRGQTELELLFDAVEVG
jgi:hypothetical protein